MVRCRARAALPKQKGHLSRALVMRWWSLMWAERCRLACCSCSAVYQEDSEACSGMSAEPSQGTCCCCRRGSVSHLWVWVTWEICKAMLLALGRMQSAAAGNRSAPAATALTTTCSLSLKRVGVLLPAAKLSPGRRIGPSIWKMRLDGGWTATFRCGCHKPFTKFSKLCSKGAAPCLMQKGHMEAHVHQCSAVFKEA